jgi:hypothetical protein
MPNDIINPFDALRPNFQVPQGSGLGYEDAGVWPGTVYTPPYPTDLRAAEAAIVAQLQANLPTTIRCEAFPDNWSSYRLTNMNGAVLARFVDADYAHETPTDIIAQWRAMRWEIMVMARVLGWTYGGNGDQFVNAYGLIESVRLALTGFQMPGFKKAYPRRDYFVDYEQGIWVYACEYIFETMAVEQGVLTPLPLFTLGQFFEEGQQTNILQFQVAYFLGTPPQIVLGHQNISQLVVADSATGYVYQAGGDYTVDTVVGIVYLTANSRIALNSEVKIGFQYADTVTARASGGNVPFAPSN